jgi:hypothetical protein
MHKQMAVFLVGAVALTFAVQQPLSSAQIVSIEAKGNLEANAPLGCVDMRSVTAAHTPADMIPGVRICLDSAEYVKAADLLAVFRAFGKFDTLRVADKTAHQAIVVLQGNHLGTAAQEHRAAAQEVLKKFGDPGSAELARLCGYLRAIGPPSYQPTYMLQHGMSAFTGQGGGLTQGFDAKVEWAKMLDGYLRCPP